MSNDETCCTCAVILNPTHPNRSSGETRETLNEKAEINKNQATAPNSDSKRTAAPEVYRRLPCCHRVICTSCVAKNERLQDLCVYCQISSVPTSLPQGLRDPPAYSSQPSSPKRRPVDPSAAEDNNPTDEQPPSYYSLESTQQQQSSSPSSSSPQQQQDVTHYLRPTDSLQSISLAYNVPASVLRSHNSIYSDHLLSARHKISIPASHYSGPSLSATPIDSEEEAERKAGIRRFMVGAKCADYGVAELYLGQAKGDVELALETWREDERWERENPLDKSRMGKRRARDEGRRKRSAYSGGGGLTGQLS